MPYAYAGVALPDVAYPQAQDITSIDVVSALENGALQDATQLVGDYILQQTEQSLFE